MQRPFDDQTRAHISAPEAASSVGATCPQVPYLYLAHQYNQFWSSEPLPPPHHSGRNVLPGTHPAYSPVPAGNESLDHCRALPFPRSSDGYNSSGSFHFSPNPLSDPSHGSYPPTLHHSMLSPTPYPDLPCPRTSWNAEDISARSVDEHFHVLRYYYPPAPPQQSPGATLPNAPGDYTLEPYSGSLGASYPCRWTEGGISCDVMVQATRSHLNRHLHTNHGFSGPDAQQTRCRWTGCGETMQQGSVARHLVTCHLQAKVTCPTCFKKLSRQDVISKHQRVCPGAGSWR